MNLSGECIQEVMNYYKTDISDLIVVYDDINLEPGQLRVRGKGSAGGHNGMKISFCIAIHRIFQECVSESEQSRQRWI